MGPYRVSSILLNFDHIQPIHERITMTDQTDFDTLVNACDDLAHTYVEGLYSTIAAKAALDAKFVELDALAPKAGTTVQKDHLRFVRQLYLDLFDNDLVGKLERVVAFWATQLAFLRNLTR